ncbi:Gfo/Idh/MocA family oxidoreductase [Rathayibacter sp. VKM Ac-2760]|uniref:Gfo/Idh/MocA family protein n=1 Tax=Rathayibacter sp. VKM Ac-2760 TaxID=2609253 RepID=UPI0013187B04|nr:Gfo/Idh/MocA family oxidoreductase [Rathayibacter sp. VKM Ac-2760]QHC60738.1 Gfo/Idh/MocA family oxidoreductase [Rathayibacter sp. VKM Ac-2760]
MRLGLVGYGTGGRFFHAPFLQVVPEIDLVGVVTRSPQRRAQAERELPHVPVFSSQLELLAAGVDAVSITTPPETRRELVLEAVAAGVHVLADKPFAPTAPEGRALAAAAAEAGVILNVFHNRRFDADIRTLQAVLESGRLGEVWRVGSRFDLDDPEGLDRGPAGGMLRDLGSHVVDQMLHLLGPAARVTARLDHVGTGEERTDAGFLVTIDHVRGATSTISSSKLNHLQQRELVAYGSLGGYRSDGTDVQAQAIFSGQRPSTDPAGWGHEREERWGTLSTAAGRERVPSAKGDYSELYRRFAAAVEGRGPEPVPASEAIETLEVLDAARESDRLGRTIHVAEPGRDSSQTL